MHCLVSHIGILIEKYHNIESATNKVIFDKFEKENFFYKLMWKNHIYVAIEYLDLVDFEQSQ